MIATGSGKARHAGIDFVLIVPAKNIANKRSIANGRIVPVRMLLSTAQIFLMNMVVINLTKYTIVLGMDIGVQPSPNVLTMCLEKTGCPSKSSSI